MTTTESATESAEGTLSQEELAQLAEATVALRQSQPTFCLLDPANASWLARMGPGQHILTIAPEIVGMLDVNVPSFVPADPEPVRQLLVTKLHELRDSEQVDANGTNVSVDWDTLQIVDEKDGGLSVRADSVAAGNGSLFKLELVLDNEFTVRLEQALLIGEDPEPVAESGAEAVAPDEEAIADAAAPVEISQQYLAQSYPNVQLTHDGAVYTVTWQTWNPDQQADGGLVGSWTTATTADGTDCETYVWVSPSTPPQIAASREVESAQAPQAITQQYLAQSYPSVQLVHEGAVYTVTWQTWNPDQQADGGLAGSWTSAVAADGTACETYVWVSPTTPPQIAATRAGEQPRTPQGITQQYLAQSYPNVQLTHEGAVYTVTWQTWNPDQQADGGLVGSWTTATTADGTDCETYVWVSPSTPPQIAATKSAAPAEQVEQTGQAAPDPEAVFPTVVENLRAAWRGQNSELTTSDGHRYDVSGFVEGNSDYEMEYVSFDGAYLVRLHAMTTGDDPRRVQCELRIATLDAISLEREDNA